MGCWTTSLLPSTKQASPLSFCLKFYSAQITSLIKDKIIQNINTSSTAFKTDMFKP
ncbi:hypothetical protein I79_007910 [Cricetulus griseus]|uniref:Uncharacterized protein n=1 Tax=Cricetulus griseus TaxID=10029 RepID=G3HBV9_CRIGR|nr:hypothetical protein I79_007910 [Cricetulus griseus]